MDHPATQTLGTSHDGTASGSGCEAWQMPSLGRCIQLLTMKNPPFLISAWTFTAAIASAVLAAIVYIYGWQKAGASFLVLSPVYAYVMVSLLQVLWMAVFGQTATAHHLRLLASALQTYYFIIPVFQPGSQVFFGKLSATQAPCN